MVVCCENVSHAAGNISDAFYGVFSSGLILMGYALYISLASDPVFAPDLWAASGRS